MQEWGSGPMLFLNGATKGAMQLLRKGAASPDSTEDILADSNRRAEQARITYLLMMSYAWRNPEEHKLAFRWSQT